MNGGIINSITRLHLVGYFYWCIFSQCIVLLDANGIILCYGLLKYFIYSLYFDPEMWTTGFGYRWHTPLKIINLLLIV